MSVLKLLDGRKRYLLLIVFVVEAVASITGHADLATTIQRGIALIGWDPSQAIVSAAVVAQLVGAGWAIFDGIQKDLAARRAAANTVSLPK
jgi:hypothetical protein